MRQSILVLALTFAAAAHAEEPPLLVGAAEVEITPPEGFLMAGYYHERQATGTRDPLMAKAIVFRGQGQAAALVACDLIGIAHDLTVEVRRLAAEATGIPPEHIVLTATHSHTAPNYAKDLVEHSAHASAGAAESAASDEPRYSARLIGGIVEAIRQADRATVEVLVSTGHGMQETPVAFNRRFVMRDGSVQTWQSLDNPEVVRAAGPVDPQIGLATFRAAASGEHLAVLSNFALHLDTVGGLLWSADYPLYIQESVRKSLGPSAVSVFGTGCCGDINHADPTRKERNNTQFIGQAIGESIDAALPKLTAVPQPELRVKHAIVPLPLAEITAEQVERSVSLLASVRAGSEAEFFDKVISYKTIMLDHLRHGSADAQPAEHINWGLSRSWAGVGDTLPVDVHVIALGRDLAIVCLPGEVFVELGLAIKQASPYRTTMVIELANCKETAYIPTRAACAGGSYEVTNSAVQPGSGEMLVEAAIGLLRQTAQQDP